MRENRNSYKVFVAKPEGRDYAEDLDVDERVIFKLMFKELGRR